MLDDGGECEGQGEGEVGGGGGATAEALDDGAPFRVAEGMEDQVRRVGTAGHGLAFERGGEAVQDLDPAILAQFGPVGAGKVSGLVGEKEAGAGVGGEDLCGEKRG